MKTHIMITDDEEKLRESIATFLKSEGFEVSVASDGEDALRQIRAGERPDLLLLDVMMPRLDGLATLRELRMANSSIPVIMLTAKAEEVDKLLGLELGADDYMTKPFSLREVVARIKAVLRRANPDDKAEECIKQGDLTINLITYEVFVEKERLTLTPTEFKILVALAEHPGRVYSRLQLMNLAMGEAYANYERSIDAHVSNLRRKLKEAGLHDKINTVYGIGYRFEAGA